MIVKEFASVTAESSVESGVPVADEVAPVIAFSPEKATYAPTEFVP